MVEVLHVLARDSGNSAHRLLPSAQKAGSIFELPFSATSFETMKAVQERF